MRAGAQQLAEIGNGRHHAQVRGILLGKLPLQRLRRFEEPASEVCSDGFGGLGLSSDLLHDLPELLVDGFLFTGLLEVGVEEDANSAITSRLKVMTKGTQRQASLQNFDEALGQFSFHEPPV